MADQNSIGQLTIYLTTIDAYVQLSNQFTNQKYDLSDLGNFR